MWVVERWLLYQAGTDDLHAKNIDLARAQNCCIYLFPWFDHSWQERCSWVLSSFSINEVNLCILFQFSVFAISVWFSLQRIQCMQIIGNHYQLSSGDTWQVCFDHVGLFTSNSWLLITGSSQSVYELWPLVSFTDCANNRWVFLA